METQNDTTQRIVKDETIKKARITIPQKEMFSVAFNAFSSLGLAILSVVLGINSIKPKGWDLYLFNSITVILAIIGLVAFVLQIHVFFEKKKNHKDYTYYVESKRLSTALLTAIKRIQFEKTSYILRSTYEKIADWHPIDYDENVLAYDIHEHLRRICIRLKELIVSFAPEDFNDDMVTVDIAYSYPSDYKFVKANPSQPTSDQPPQSSTSSHTPVSRQEPDDEEKLRWKAITSGDHTSLHVSIQKYLDNEYSFYKFLETKGYHFCNDKKELEKDKHYVTTNKDDENKDSGSIVGIVIDLKNDIPETPLVRVYLTISTYGRKFVEPQDPLPVLEFERLFKETVINSFKTLIEEELSSMFIRHGIHEGYIDRKTGLIKLKEVQSKSES